MYLCRVSYTQINFAEKQKEGQQMIRVLTQSGIILNIVVPVKVYAVS